ncbi:glutathione S-transferase family protein [Rugamonas sp.]|uniref:glutathione S-transferase family protein n=1 Tax=Rugamonas sp. TaxID=1926287 RepID=UPI0025D5EE38|nr:glutathione S-transferase [Rugamonas sp.]
MTIATPAKPAQPIRLHRHYMSGHCHRVELLLSMLDLPYETVDVDIPAGQHKGAAFLELNPLGQVPVLEDGDLVLYDSNAILVYLASRYDDGRWLPRDPVAAARVQQWLSMAAGPIAAGPNSTRLVKLFGAPLDYPRARMIAENLFAVLDAQLGQRSFATGEQPTIADLAAFSYIAMAPDGDVSLEPYPQLRAWLRRIEQLPGFVALPKRAAAA